jgi:hypothetical protein
MSTRAKLSSANVSLFILGTPGLVFDFVACDMATALLNIFFAVFYYSNHRNKTQQFMIGMSYSPQTTSISLIISIDMYSQNVDDYIAGII